MATHPTDERPERHEDDPRDLEPERSREAHEAAPRNTAHDPDGEVVRSEPAAARGGDPPPGRHEPHEQPPSTGGASVGGGHPDAPTPAEGRPGNRQEAAHAGNGDRLIRSSESDDLRRRWESIQASFIDAPREAVQEADRLVGELTDRIAERFRSERSGLETQWERGDEVSTEELRLTLQRYRGFLDRLLDL